jgi:hypothetical protein
MNCSEDRMFHKSEDLSEYLASDAIVDRQTPANGGYAPPPPWHQH